MKTVYFNDGQGGSEWLDWRRNGIGASDIGVLMGSHPSKTPLGLWEEKCGFSSDGSLNMAMKHGIKNEPKARSWLNKNLDLKLKPLCVEDNSNPEFRASLDGYDSDKKVLAEIKCPVSEKILDRAREDRVIPLQYQHQIQWQIMLTKPIRAFVAFWDYRYNQCFTLEAVCQPALQKEMKEKASDFWRRVVAGVSPPAQNKDYIDLEDDALRDLLQEYKDHCDLSKAAEERKKALRDQISKFGDGANFRAYGFTVSKCEGRPTYNLEQMRCDGVNVDAYAKKPSNAFYRIKCPSS